MLLYMHWHIPASYIQVHTYVKVTARQEVAVRVMRWLHGQWLAIYFRTHSAEMTEIATFRLFVVRLSVLFGIYNLTKHSKCVCAIIIVCTRCVWPCLESCVIRLPISIYFGEHLLRAPFAHNRTELVVAHTSISHISHDLKECISTCTRFREHCVCARTHIATN